MTDRIVVSRAALEQTLRFLSGDREIARDYLREIIDTAEEFPPVDKRDIETAESAWITERGRSQAVPRALGGA